MVWLEPSVLLTAPLQSLPIPNTHELARVVIREAVDAPAAELPLPDAPIAFTPFAVPVNETRVIERDDTLWFSVTVTVPVIGVGEYAHQISAVPI